MTISLSNLKAIAKTIIRFIKPDYRRVVGWFLITTGVAMISPPVLQKILLEFLHITIPIVFNSHDDRMLGIYIFSLGIQFLLWYGASEDNLKIELRICLMSIWIGSSALIALVFTRLL